MIDITVIWPRKVEVQPLRPAQPGEMEMLKPVSYEADRQMWKMHVVAGGIAAILWMPRERIEDAKHAEWLATVNH